ncbi:MAG TPA: YceI family protein [Iamia sp.]|nr:YceI family protein [Iamia sp.]
MTTTRGRRATTVLLGTGLAVVLLGGAALWWVVLRDDTPAEAALVDREVVTTQRAADDHLSGPWTMVPGPDVWAGYRITEHMGGLDNVAVARTGDVDASLTLAGTDVTAVTVEVDMTTLVSQDTELPGVGGRDDAMHGSGLETDLHPTATFTLTEPIELGDLPEPGTEVTADAVGVLDLHGVERPVTIPVAARWNGEVIDLTASVDITLADHAIDPPAPKIVTLADTGTIELQLTFARP